MEWNELPKRKRALYLAIAAILPIIGSIEHIAF